MALLVSQRQKHKGAIIMQHRTQLKRPCTACTCMDARGKAVYRRTLKEGAIIICEPACKHLAPFATELYPVKMLNQDSDTYKTTMRLLSMVWHLNNGFLDQW